MCLRNNYFYKDLKSLFVYGNWLPFWQIYVFLLLLFYIVTCNKQSQGKHILKLGRERNYDANNCD